MLGIKICGLANAVGLTQAAIAEHLGVDRAQVNRWAKGVRPVPEHVRTALTAYVLGVVRRCVDALDAKLAETGPLGRAIILDERGRLMKWAGECLVGDMEAAGEGPTEAIYAGLESLDTFKTMTPGELRKPVNTEQLLRRIEILRTQAALLCRIAPMFDVLLKEESDADDRKQSAQFDATSIAEPSVE